MNSDYEKYHSSTRMKKERAAVVSYAKTLGYTAEEIQVASDHRAVKALYDSWRLSTLNKETDVAKKKVRKAPKMAKAGTPRAKGESQTRRKKQLSQRLNKERSVNAAVDLLLGQKGVVLMATATTANAVGEKETLADVIYKVDSDETPIFSSTAKTTINGVFAEWQVQF